tara:strand:- start:761 stop:1927 length:1167 start_codon:yes stop_codon:yes gene_type:complete
MATKNILILGSTGSIGLNTLEVIRMHLDKYNVVALSADKSIDVLFNQCIEFNPEYAYLSNEKDGNKLSKLLKEKNVSTKVISGKDSLNDLVRLDNVDTIVNAITGAAGLQSSLTCLEYGKNLLLANKEPIVMCGKLFLETAKKNNSVLLPIDSEHNAIHQCLSSRDTSSLEKIIITASGGPFLRSDLGEFPNFTVNQALNHPTWDMGNKISIDSATMMNKGLEVIEAMYLFGLSSSFIDVVIHPQSLVHSMVCYKDGSIISQISENDMRIPISYCLAWPDRISSGVKAINLLEKPPLTFEEVNRERFPCFYLAREVAENGGSYPIILNASNEVAVEAFIKEQIKFTDIYKLVNNALDSIKNNSQNNLEDVLETDRITREHTLNMVKKI